MSDTLREALTDIQGIGDARADEILELVDEHGAAERIDVDALRDDLDDALSYQGSGDYQYSKKFIARARRRIPE